MHTRWPLNGRNIFITETLSTPNWMWQFAYNRELRFACGQDEICIGAKRFALNDEYIIWEPIQQYNMHIFLYSALRAFRPVHWGLGKHFIQLHVELGLVNLRLIAEIEKSVCFHLLRSQNSARHTAQLLIFFCLSAGPLWAGKCSCLSPTAPRTRHS